jgi:hypothetical protein
LSPDFLDCAKQENISPLESLLCCDIYPFIMRYKISRILLLMLALNLLFISSIFPAQIVRSETSDPSSGVVEESPISAQVNSYLLQGYNIAVVDAGYNPTVLETTLENRGALVDRIPVASLTVVLLENYDLLWIDVGGADDVDLGGKASVVLDYIQGGGGLIFSQPNEAMVPQCLPYMWTISSNTIPPYYEATAIVDISHPLTRYLTVEDMPDNFDTIGPVGPEWKILARTQSGDPTFACSEYGDGKVIVQMDAPYNEGVADITGDMPSLSDAMVLRMVQWLTGRLPFAPAVGGELQPVSLLAPLAPWTSIVLVVFLTVSVALLKRKKLC